MTAPDEKTTLIAEVVRLRHALAAAEAESCAELSALRIALETLENQRDYLNEAVDWYAELYEFAPIAYLALDGAGLIREINLTGATLLGMERQRLLGRPMRLHVAPDDRRAFLEHLYRSRRADAAVVSELRILASGEREVPAQLISRRGSGGEGPLTLRTAIFDISERRRAEEDLQLSHRRLSLALTASQAGLYEYTVGHERLRTSARWAEILGMPSIEAADTALRAWFEARIDPADREARGHAHAAFMAGEHPNHLAEFRVRRLDGAWVWVRELAQAAQRGVEGRPSRVVGVLLDIGAEKQRLAEAERRTSQLREMSAALYRVEETERRELATLLHDDLGQRLVAAQLRMAALTREAEAPLSAGLDAVAQILRGAQDTIRSLSFQLSPPILHELGLVAALRWLAGELGGTLGLAVDVDEDDPLPPLRGQPEVVLFRCVRELLLNVAKHAGVRQARVIVRDASDSPFCQIAVEDNGVGFAAERLMSERSQARSFGLLSVFERIEGLGGRVHIESAPGQGTQVLLLLPRDDLDD